MSAPTLRNSTSNLTIDENQWILQIQRALANNLEDHEYDIPVCIFNVPKTLRATNPDSYTPQVVAIGPYHHWHPELHEMERYKLSSAKRTQNHFHNTTTFQTLVNELMTLDPKIRGCYHKYLDISVETLAWMMAIDAAFLLEFLHIYNKGSRAVLLERVVPSRISHLVDYMRRKSTYNEVLRDIIMVENQIPLFVLRKMLEFKFHDESTTKELVDDTILMTMLVGLCEDVSPFKMASNNFVRINDRNHHAAHLLDFLYQLVVVHSLEDETLTDIIEDGDKHEESIMEEEDDNQSSHHPNFVKKVVEKVRSLLLQIKTSLTSFIKKLMISKPMKLIFRLPFIIISNLPGFTILKQPLDYLFFSDSNEPNDNLIKPTENSTLDLHNNQPPLIEEIMIPSVTELSKSGVQFLPTTNASISAISFDPIAKEFNLPTIHLDENSEVTLRNLVAYEASGCTGPLVFTRYIELMNGIIDTRDDVKLLREKGIILNHFKSDEEVAHLWNGMSKSIKLTKVRFLDQVIADVNKYYDGQWKVKVNRLIKVYVITSWKFLLFIVVVVFMMLMSLQAFSFFFSFRRLMRVI